MAVRSDTAPASNSPPPFSTDLAEVWAEHGKATMVHTAKCSPEVFFATCARLIPKDVELTVRQHYSFDLDPADLEILRAIKACIPNAGSRAPSEVFNEVLNAIKTNNARQLIDTSSEDQTEGPIN